MRSMPMPSAVVVKREQKEGQLRSFLETQLGLGGSPGRSLHGTTLRFLARSPESPAARALRALNGDIVRAGIKVEVIFALLENGDPSWLEADAHGFACEIRHAANPRLLDAHEQLVIDESTAWIGDCMRRDPDKRDAFECFATDARETARYAAVSFSRLWSMSVPVRTRTQAASPGPSLTDPAFTPPPDTGSAVMASTRH